MTKKNIIYLIIAGIAVILACLYLLTPGSLPEQEKPEPAVIDQPDDSVTLPAPMPAPAMPAEQIDTPEPVAVKPSEEKPVMGQFIRVRELRESDTENSAIRNLEIVFREGVLPRKLFADDNQVILKYDQLTRNIEGSGATTVFFYYEVVTQDTNGDGMLSGQDAITVAVSRPEGGNYRVLISNVDEVLAYEHLPEEETLRLNMRMGDRVVTNTYSLSGT